MADLVQKSSLDNSFETRIRKGNEEILDDVKELSEEVDKRGEKKLKPIVKKGNVKVQKPGAFSKIRKSIISEDMADVLSYGLYDIVIPGIKDGFFSILEHMFYGGSPGDYYRDRSRRRYDDRDRSYTNYSSYYKSSLRRGDRDRDRDRDRRDRRDDEYRNERVDYRRIIVKNRRDAEDIVQTLRDYIHDYDSVSVARLLDLIDEPGKYVDNDWGWTRESDINYRATRNGFLIEVPEAEYLGD